MAGREAQAYHGLVPHQSAEAGGVPLLDMHDLAGHAFARTIRAQPPGLVHRGRATPTDEPLDAVAAPGRARLVGGIAMHRSHAELYQNGRRT
jgi:hypothetical protein